MTEETKSPLETIAKLIELGDLRTFEVVYPCAKDLISFVFSNVGGLDYIACCVCTAGLVGYEGPMASLMVSLAQDADVILDVGANTGLYTLLVAAANPKARVFAFEPLEYIRNVLEVNICLNPILARRISVQPFALSDQDGTFEFYETINEAGLLPTSSSLNAKHATSHSHGAKINRTVLAMPLDRWAEQNLNGSKVQLIKIDVEGHEHAVFAGARELIARDRPFIIYELLPGVDSGPIRDLVQDGSFLDFAVAPQSLRQSNAIRAFADAANHLLCPRDNLARIFTLCRQLGMKLELA